MALGDVDCCLEGRRYCPVDGKETDESPEYQSEIYESPDPEDVEPANRFAVIDITVENRKGQLGAPLSSKVQGSGFKGSGFRSSMIQRIKVQTFKTWILREILITTWETNIFL